jgi:type I restriction enzyme S subunit
MIADLKPYAEYKESGLPWLGQVPKHWTIKRGKSYLTVVDERSKNGQEELLTVSSARGVVPRRTANVTMFKAKSYIGHKLCWPNDLVINSLWAWSGGLGVSNQHGIVSTAYSVYRSRPSVGINPRFLHELVRSSAFHWELQVRSKGVWISRLQLTDTAFLDAPLPLPPPDEQAAIARFLDWANGRLERAIRAKRKVIALLNEQKQAIIHRAVTRGLDPSVPLKPSGILWLGDIPAHWEVRRFKTSVGFQEGPGIMLSDFRESGVPLLRISCLAGAEATLAGCNYLSPAKVSEKWSHFAVKPGDYLLSASGSTGAVRRASGEVVGAIPYTGIIRLWPKSRAIDMEYLRLFMSARPFAEQISMAKSGVGIEHFGPTHLKRMWILQPPIEEQTEIVGEVRSATAGLETGVSRLEREIDLLREYRIRLVADVVTGKLDVREAAVRLSDEEVLQGAADAGDDDLDDTSDDLPDEEADE